ncbi:histidine triad nucleotide-binding protein [Legionella sp. CNM-1927-20]|uniref:histidine triad nucleotide-binding protein n=1 Tax=Legionella sp. CNM-1927-20 TaxID=3422221 RepID=UPI00403AC386
MDCLFCKIAQGEIKANTVYEDKNMVAFHDIHPQAPTHILIIPRKHITTINDVEHADEQLLGQMILKAKDIAKAQQLSDSGYRLIFNVNAGGGQAVYHIHLHLLGGRQMMWPPG